MTESRPRAWVALVVLAAAMVACGPSSNQISSATTVPPTTASSAAPASTTTTPPPSGRVAARVYFMRGDHLGVVRRLVEATAPAGGAVTQLLAGPSSAEAAAGLATAVPPGTRLLGIDIDAGLATVDLSGTFATGGGSLSMVARLAQVTYTLTQFPTVRSVNFRLDGKPVTVFGGEGILLDHPATRASFETVTPAILVESPAPGDPVTSPVRLTGTANVFEAVFRAELTDAAGHVVADQQVKASSGTGTRGGFDALVAYSGSVPGVGTLTVYDLSAKDGSRQDAVAIPIVIAVP